MTCEWEKFRESTEEEKKKLYSKIAFQRATEPKNRGDMKDTDGYARVQITKKEPSRILLSFVHHAQDRIKRFSGNPSGIFPKRPRSASFPYGRPRAMGVVPWDRSNPFSPPSPFSDFRALGGGGK